MSTAFITGGSAVTLALDAREATFAQHAFNVADSAYAWGKVWTDLNSQSLGGSYNVYDITPATGATVHLPAGGQALVLEGSVSAQMVGHIGQEMLIGNSGNDTINAAGGDGTIISGAGRDYISLNSLGLPGGSQYIFTGPQADVINMWGGSATVDGGATNTVNLRDGHNTLVGSTALDVVVTGINSQNDITLTGASYLQINSASSDTVSTASTGATAIFLNHAGTVKATINGHAGDRVYVESGVNTLQTSGASLVVLGGTNQIASSGEKVVVAGGTNVFNATGAGNVFVEHGGANTVNVNAGSAEITYSGPADVLNLSGGGSDVLIGSGVVNITDNANYTIVVQGNDTIDFGNGADTVVHGAATVHAGGGGISVTGGSSAPNGHATVLGGSASHAVGAMAHPATPAGHGGELAAKLTGLFGADRAVGHGFSGLHAGAPVTLAAYVPAAAHVGGQVLSMDHGMTKITIDGANHAGGMNFGHL